MNKKQARSAALDIIKALIFKEAASPTGLTDKFASCRDDYEAIKAELLNLRKLIDNKCYPRHRKSKLSMEIERQKREREIIAQIQPLSEQELKEMAEYEDWLSSRPYPETD